MLAPGRGNSSPGTSVDGIVTDLPMVSLQIFPADSMAIESIQNARVLQHRMPPLRTEPWEGLHQWGKMSHHKMLETIQMPNSGGLVKEAMTVLGNVM